MAGPESSSHTSSLSWVKETLLRPKKTLDSLDFAALKEDPRYLQICQETQEALCSGLPDLAPGSLPSVEEKSDDGIENTDELSLRRIGRVPKTPAITPQEQKFLDRYDPLIVELCKQYGLSRTQFLSLVERETNFQDDFTGKKKKGSFGYGQLMKVVFDDMKVAGKDAPGGRADRYAPLLSQWIQNQALRDRVTSGPHGKEVANLFDTLTASMENGKVIDPIRYNHAITDLYRLARRDQNVNLFVSSILQNALAADIDITKIMNAKQEGSPTSSSEEKRLRTFERSRSLVLNVCWHMRDTTIQRLITRWPGESFSLDVVEKYRTAIMKSIAETQSGCEDFLTLLRYNGNSKPEPGEKIPHQAYYAMSVMIREQIRLEAAKSRS